MFLVLPSVEWGGLGRQGRSWAQATCTEGPEGTPGATPGLASQSRYAVSHVASQGPVLHPVPAVEAADIPNTCDQPLVSIYSLVSY